MGLDGILRNLERLERNAKNLNGPVAFEDLFPPEFMRGKTDFKTISEMGEASGWNIASTEDFAAIPDAEWDAFVKARTRFENWEKMQRKAVVEYAARRLSL